MQTDFLIFQKAFGTVPHAKLISKQTALNVPPHLVSWISSYLYSRKQQVFVSGAYSATVNVTSGVPQGSMLGRLLFLIYVDGLAELSMHGGRLIMVAYDALLYKVVPTSKTWRVMSIFLFSGRQTMT